MAGRQNNDTDEIFQQKIKKFLKYPQMEGRQNNDRDEIFQQKIRKIKKYP